MLRLLILIPFALIVSMSVSLVALAIASVVSADLALLIGGGFERLMEAIFAFADAGIDPSPAAAAALALLARLGFAIIVAPVLLVCVLSEILRVRSGLAQSAVTGALTAGLPLAMLSLARTPTAAETRVIGALFIVGLVTGFSYWLIAGRSAAEPRVEPHHA